MRRWVTLAVIVLVLNFAWEMAQGGLFRGMTELPFWNATGRCSQATAGDLVITCIAFGGGAIAARRLDWPKSRHLWIGFVPFLSLGMVMTVMVERWAVSTGRWTYSSSMPVIAGVGVAPLLQWLILPTLEVVAARALPAA